MSIQKTMKGLTEDMHRLQLDVEPGQLKGLCEINDDTNPQKLSKLGGISGLTEKLRTNIECGLPAWEFKSKNYGARKTLLGINQFKEPPYLTFWEMLKEAFDDDTLKILIISAIVSLVLGVTVEDPSTGWIEGTAILAAVLIVSLVTAVNDWQKQRQFRNLNRAKDDINVNVIREKLNEEEAGIGEQRQISIHDVVAGDIVIIEMGCKIPADGILFYTSELKICETAMTGESDDIRKKENDVVLAGTSVSSGEGKYLVTGVGVYSQWGAALEEGKKEAESADEKTPLQEKLEVMADQIGKLGMISAVITVTILVITWGFHLFKSLSAGVPFEFKELVELVDFLIIGITIVVVAVPEGLPLAVTISLAYSMKKMMKDNNLVRHLSSCETMGNATMICSDKTGTLTENKMTVTEGLFFGRKYDKVPEEFEDYETLNLFCDSIAVNSKAFFNLSSETGELEPVGSKTECALLSMIEKWNKSYEEIRAKYHDDIDTVFTFTSKRKRMSSVIRFEGRKRSFVKGAAEIILGKCIEYMDGSESKAFDPESRKHYEEIISEMASSGLRTLALTYKDYDGETTETTAEENLILLGIVGIKDPLRQGVPEAVEDCRAAGVLVRMVTGDNLSTAKHIATDCKILTGAENEIAMEGFTFRNMTDEERREMIPNLRVLARSSPKDKLILVKLLRSMEQVVGVTGDGTNDAPALKEADVGLSMGIAGTDVAKEASDIVILDDNFKSIVTAIMWGRSVYDNIRKFLQFQLTINVVALATSVLSAVLGKGSPLKAVQLLWVNLIMDTLAALALGTEPPTRDLLKRKPYSKSSPLLSPAMKRNIATQAIFQLTILIGIIWFGPSYFGYDMTNEVEEIHLNAILFNTFIFLQVFNKINCRKINDEPNIFKGIFNNMIFMTIWFAIIGVQVLVIEKGGAFFATCHLTKDEWIFSMGIGALSIPLGYIFRLIPVPAEK